MAANVAKIRDALGLMKDIIPKLPEEKLDERGLYTIKK